MTSNRQNPPPPLSVKPMGAKSPAPAHGDEDPTLDQLLEDARAEILEGVRVDFDDLFDDIERKG